MRIVKNELHTASTRQTIYQDCQIKPCETQIEKTKIGFQNDGENG